MISNRNKIIITFIIAICIGFFLMNKSVKNEMSEGINTPEETVATENIFEKILGSNKKDVTEINNYYSLTLTTETPLEELRQYVDGADLENTLKLNRINSEFLKPGSSLVLSYDIKDFMSLSPFPKDLKISKEIPKLLLISQRVQAFAVYENGELVRWGPVSTGKKLTPTESYLYFTNWKAKEAISTFDDEWIMKWNFNLDNIEGTGMHQYEMPGEPASHSCVRLFEDDAKWLYNWADQWILSKNEQTVLASGTPVIIFGHYEYDKIAPWKNLLTDQQSLDITPETLDNTVSFYKKKIMEEMEKRNNLTNN